MFSDHPNLPHVQVTTDDAENDEDLNHTVEVDSDRYNHTRKKTGPKKKAKKTTVNAIKVYVSFSTLQRA